MINNASVPVGTTYTPSGGTATSFKTKSNRDNHIAYLDDGSELIDQVTAEFSVKEAKVLESAPNGYSQARNSVFVRNPLALDNGGRTMNTGSVSLNCDIETTDAEKLAILELLAHFILDSDFAEFWLEQSQS